MARGSYVANGNILPFSICKFDTSSGNSGKVLQAGSGDIPMGVAQCQQDQAPLAGLQSGYAAVAGENIAVYDPADPENQTLIRVDAAYPQGTLIKPGSNGIGTQATADGDYYIGRLMQASLVANDVVMIMVIFGMRGA